jgi:DNA-binding CsgD family transcriptional regulator
MEELHLSGGPVNQSLATIVRNMMAVAASLSALDSADKIERATADMVGSVIPADEILLMRLDLGGDGTQVRTGDDLQVDEDISGALARVGHLHPAVLSYLAPGDDGRPRRVSDVASHREWWSSGAFQEVFRTRPGRYQLSVVTQLDGAVGTGWVLMRARRDFSAADVEAAHVLHPLLTALMELAAVKSRTDPHPCASLTSRELVVLELLATGRSARGIARDLGITEGTARKHLSHIYAKLNVHDRLSAVLALQRRV